MGWAGSCLPHLSTGRPVTRGLKTRTDGVLTFLGYGNPHGPVWFLGQEEGLPDDADAQRQLTVRARFGHVMDCRAAHERLGIHHLHGLRGQPVKVQRTWRQMCNLMLCITGREFDSPAVAEYQRSELGSSEGQTFLAELMPLPKSRQSAWPYGSLLGSGFRGQMDYQKKVWPIRAKLLGDALAEYRPKLVICYGAAEARFAELLGPATGDLQRVDGTSFKAAFGPGQVALVVPHFAQRFGGFPTTDFLNAAIGAAVLAGLELPLSGSDPKGHCSNSPVPGAAQDRD